MHRYAPCRLSSLAGFFLSLPVVLSLRAVNFGSGRRNRRIKSRRKARAVAALLAGLYLGALAAHAQNGPFLYVPSNVKVTPPLGVSVVDTSTNTVPFAPIPAGPGIAVAVRGDESAIWVSNDTNGTVTPVETAANSVGGPIQLTGGPFVQGLAITPNGKTLYATTVSITGSPGALGFLTPINTATNEAGTPIGVGLNPRDVVVSPVGNNTVWVANLILADGQGAVTPIVNNLVGSRIELGAGQQAFSLAITPNGNTLYATNPFGNNVALINTTNGSVTPINVGAGSFGIAPTPNGQRVYVALAFAHEVAVINVVGNAVTFIPLAPGPNGAAIPNGVAVSPDGKTVYITDLINNEVIPISTNNNMPGTPIPVVDMPEIFPGIASNGNALLASGLTFVANTSGALESTLASGPIGSPGPIFTGGTLQFAGPNITSSLPITVETEGGTFDTLANTATLSGPITGPGSLTKIGTGILTLTGDNSYSGGTTISAGTLQIGDGGTTGNIIGNVTDNGTLSFNRSGDKKTFAGLISGSGDLVKLGSDTLVLTAINTYTGGTNFNDGILAVEGNGHLGPGPLRFTGGTLEDLTGGNLLENADIELDPAGEFIADTDTTSTFRGTISGTGSFTKTGPGTLILSGANTFSGGTTIEEGTLVVGVPSAAGTLSAAQEISQALGSGDVFLLGGTLRTTSFQTGVPLQINVGGNYTQGPGGTLALGIGGLQPEQFDHVAVKGNAFLSGNLVVSSLNGFHPSTGDAFELLSTGGKVSGNFSLLDDSQFNNNPTITGQLKPVAVEVVAPNGVLLVYLKRPPTIPPPTIPPTPPIIDETPEPLPPVNPEEPIPEEEVAQLVDPTAEQLTSMFEIGFSGANSQRFNLNDRMVQIQQTIVPPPPTPTPIFEKGAEGKAPPPPAYQPGPCWGVWANGWGDFVNVYNDPEAKGYQFTTGGMSAGIDYRITDHLAVGLFGGYSHTWTDLKPGNVDVDTGRGGLYATYFDPQGWWVNAGIWGGYNSYSTSRQALLGPANGSTNGYEVSTFGDAGYDIHCGNLTFGPVVSMQYTTVHIDSFTEHGSLVPLNIHADSEDSLRTDAGARASYTWHAGKIVVVPQVELDWEHEFKYSNLPITVSAPVLNGATATLTGPNIGHDSLIINAGVGLQINPQLSIYIGYQGQQFRGDYEANAVTGTFSFSF